LVSFGIKYWFLYLLAALLAAVGVILIAYFRNKDSRELSKTQLWILIPLRYVAFFLIAFLLLSPFVRNLKKITQNPIVITAWDNSSSMISIPDSLKVIGETERIRDKMVSDLSDKYSVVEYTFGEQTSLLQTISYSEKKTDYNDAINNIINNHFNENIGALVLVGDGINNQGKNPLNTLSEINFPIFTLGFGDTTEIVDSRILDIRVNRTSFSGNKFPVEIDAQFSKLSGKPLKLSISQENKELTSVVITPVNPNYFYSETFILDAGNAGLKHFSVKIEPVENERNIENNISGFVINVLEDKQKILILSDGPHPDIGAIKNTLSLQSTYDVSVFTAEPFPSDLSDFNLLILNQIPTAGNSASEILSKAKSNRIPVLFMVGNKTFLPQLNTLAQGINIRTLAGSGEEAQAAINKAYGTFNLSDDLKEILPKFPPLLVPFAEYELQDGFTPLFYQRIMNIETAKPLLATGIVEGRKTGFVLGEGIWRWRLFDYYQNQNHILFNELVNQLVQYLALRQNEDNFMIDFNPVYDETDDIILKAEVYNDAYERINTEEITAIITNSQGEELEYTFDVQGENYLLNAGHLPMGDYSFDAEVTVGNETYTESGQFTITPVNFETLDLKANHTLLYQLAIQSGGKFFTPEEITELIAEIKNNNSLKATSYFQEMVNELLNLKWLFFVILALLSVEWFLRKYWGIY